MTRRRDFNKKHDTVGNFPVSAVRGRSFILQGEGEEHMEDIAKGVIREAKRTSDYIMFYSKDGALLSSYDKATGSWCRRAEDIEVRTNDGLTLTIKGAYAAP